MGSQAALPCSNLLCDFKDNILLCQQRKVTPGRSFLSAACVIKGVPKGAWGQLDWYLGSQAAGCLHSHVRVFPQWVVGGSSGRHAQVEALALESGTQPVHTIAIITVWL